MAYFTSSGENVMNPTETTALLSLKEEFIESVEPITLLSNLFRNGYVSKGFYKSVQLLLKNGNKKEEIMSYLIDSLPFHVGFPALVITLDKCGYYKLAARLFLKLFESNLDYRIHSSRTVSRTKVQSFFRNLKRMVHDSQFKNPRHTLRNMAVRCKADLDSEVDENKRQVLADRCVAIIGVEIDAYYDSLACENEITQEEMFSEMKSLIPHSSNPLLTDTIYYTRKANMNAFHGNIDHAGNMLIQARTSAYNVEHCLELVNMLYVEVYVKLWEFEMNPSKAVLESLMMWGRIGLESLETESEATKLIWRRMFILRMVFALLGIGNRANIIPQYTVEPSCIQEAQTLLAVVDTNWNGIEVRREMFYCVARARLNEQLKRFEEAKYYIDRAKLLAVQGRFLEKIPFIDDYANVLVGKVRISSLSLSTDINEMPFAPTETPLPNLDSIPIPDNQHQVLKGNGIVFMRDRDNQTIEDNRMEISQSGTNCLQTLKNICESDLLQNEDGHSQLVTNGQLINCSDRNIVVEPNHQYSNGGINIEMDSLKGWTSAPRDQVTSARIQSCHSSFSETPRKGLALAFEELKLSGGNLVLRSNISATGSPKLNMDNFSENSNTEAKVVVEDSGSCCLQSDQSEREQQRDNCFRHQLLCQCQEGVDFGSVALFEERGEGEGCSNIHSMQMILPNIKQNTSANNYARRNVKSNENELGSDIDDDDDALFGDGARSSPKQ